MALLAVVGRHDAHPVQALGEVGEDVRDAVAHPVVAALGRPAEPERHADERRHDEHHGDEREAHVHGEEHHGDDDHGQALDRELGEPVLQELLQVLDVARHAAHEHARLLGGEEVERQALQMGEDPRAEIVHHPGGETTGDLDAGALQQCGRDDGGEVQAGDEDDDREVLVTGRHAVVDGDLGQLRPRLQDRR